MNSKRVTLLLAFALLFPRLSNAADAPRTARVCLKDACVNAEIADSDAARMRGLMFRESLADTGGMLFIFSRPDRYSFWMMNMSIPLDIIWIDAEYRIVDIKPEVAPCRSGACESISPRADALYVLEVQAGFTRRHQTTIGDIISINN